MPDRHNFLPLLKETRADNQAFAYRRVPWGKNLYIHSETVKVIVDIMLRLHDDHREELLDLVPLKMTTLAMRCWELQTHQVRYRYMFKRMEPVAREFYQYEFEFMEKKNERTEQHDPFDEGCPLCGHKAH